MNPKEQIIFFDGHCNLCNAFIDFVIRWDKKRVFKVASLQGKTALKLLDITYTTELTSVVLLDSQRIFTKTDAALRIVGRIHWLLSPVYIFLVFPPILRDPLYNYIARNRYKLFGKQETCRLPTQEEQKVFLP